MRVIIYFGTILCILILYLILKGIILIITLIINCFRPIKGPKCKSKLTLETTSHGARTTIYMNLGVKLGNITLKKNLAKCVVNKHSRSNSNKV